MNNKQKQPAIMWIVRQGFYLYVNGNEKLFSFAFSPDSVLYFDVIDEIKLQHQITVFLKQNNVQSLRLYVIIGPDGLAERELQFGSEEEKKMEEKKFIDLVPYERLFSKIWTQPKNKIAAVNADILNNIRTVIEKNGGIIEWVIPYFIINQSAPNLKAFQFLLKKPDSFKSDTMIEQHISGNGGNINTPPQARKKNSSLPLLIAVFAILMIILIALIIVQNKPPARQQAQPAGKVSSEIMPLPIVTSTGSALLKKDITIMIMNGSGDANQESKLRSILVQLGYVRIEATESAIVNSQTNMVSFKPTIQSQVRNELFDALNKEFQPLSIQENITITSDVLIFMVKKF